MTRVEQLLIDLAAQGLKLWVEDGSLRLRAPKGTMTPQLREKLEQNKAEILAFLQRSATDNAAASSAIEIIDRNSALPLSFSQERFWFLGQMYPDSPASNLPNGFWLDGKLDADALRDSVNDIVARHATLRTRFVMRDEQAVQAIAPELELPLDVEDLSSLTGQQGMQEARRRAADEAATPFDLTEGPLLRLRLFRFTATHHLFVWTVHHIVSDGWSSMVFLRELQENYQARINGQTVEREALPIEFVDFAAWERGSDHQQAIAPQIEYWQSQLGNPLPPVLALSADRQRPAVVSYRGGSVALSFSAQLRDALTTLAQSRGATVFMLLLAAFQVLLHRLSGQNDVAVGTPIAGRNRHEFEGLIGCFINTLVIRAKLDGRTTFNDFLTQIKQRCVEAYSNQDVPFERLVQEIQPQRSTAYSPIFQAMLILHVQDTRKVNTFGDVKVTPEDLHSCTSKFDITLELRETGDSLDGWLEYNSDLFDESTVKHFGCYLGCLLDAIAADPETPINRLPLLGDEDRRQLLIDWNATARDYDTTLTLPALVAAQSANTPDAVAVRFGDVVLSYAELGARTERLARVLRHQRIGRETRVGIYLNRSHDMLIAVLAVLKAGGAYVPLDPQYPAERLAFMMQDAGLTLLLTTTALRASVADYAGAVLCLEDIDAAAPNEVSTTAPMPSADDLAYVIYTSGSTGLPKGVEVTHGALLNFLLSMREQPGLASNDRLLAVTTLSFDIAALELYLPLLAGAEVVIVDRATAADGLRLAAELSHSQATAMQATPSTWRMLLEAGWQGDGRLTILSGGEPLPRELAERLLMQGGELWNLYGPTETTIWSTVNRVAPGTGPVLAGRPIANTEIYILDEEQQPVPIGVTGELLIGGRGLARGYMNRETLTAARFIPHPFDATPGARLYRTGDLARYHADGEIEVLGRIDHQVKLRGYRIELGEIEAVLAEHPSVAEVVVVVPPAADGSAGTQLVAYVVDRGDAAAEDLRALARQRLPEYMVPAHIVQLETLPRTANEKIDRKALPAVEAAAIRGDIAYQAPQTETQQMLADIWSDVLDLEQVGINDDFFDLGGHSLMAVKLFSRIIAETGRRLPMASLFTAPTIALLAVEIERHDAAAAARCLVPINSRGNRPPLYCIHGEGGEVLFYRPLSEHLGSDQPVYGLQAYGLDGVNPPDTSVEAMTERYLVEVRAQQPHGPYHIAGHCFGALVAFEMAQRLKQEGEEVALLALLDGAGPPVDRTLRDSLGNFATAFTRDPVCLCKYLLTVEMPFRRKQAVTWWQERRANGEEAMPEASDDPIQRALDAVANTISTAYYDYQPRLYDGKVVCFVNSDRSLLKFNRWDEFARKGTQTIAFEGSASTSFGEPSIGYLADELRRHMDEMLRQD